MSKRKKHNLPESIGDQLKRANPSPKPFDPTDDSGRDLTLAFLKKHERKFGELQGIIDTYASIYDGNGLILMDAALLALCARIRDHLGRLGLEVK